MHMHTHTHAHARTHACTHAGTTAWSGARSSAGRCRATCTTWTCAPRWCRRCRPLGPTWSCGRRSSARRCAPRLTLSTPRLRRTPHAHQERLLDAHWASHVSLLLHAIRRWTHPHRARRMPHTHTAPPPPCKTMPHTHTDPPPSSTTIPHAHTLAHGRRRQVLAETLWAKSHEPLRAALMAAQLCRSLSRMGHLRTAAQSKWPSWRGHSWPLRAPQAVSEGLRLLYALGRRGMAPQTTAGNGGSSATHRPSCLFCCV